MESEYNGTEIESFDKLNEGDRVTVIKDTDINVEQTGTAYKIPETEIVEDVVVVDSAVVADISEGGFGVVTTDLTDCTDKENRQATDLMAEWCNGDHATVIVHNDE